jgi:hypothetical protein
MPTSSEYWCNIAYMTFQFLFSYWSTIYLIKLDTYSSYQIYYSLFWSLVTKIPFLINWAKQKHLKSSYYLSNPNLPETSIPLYLIYVRISLFQRTNIVKLYKVSIIQKKTIIRMIIFTKKKTQILEWLRISIINIMRLKTWWTDKYCNKSCKQKKY